MPVRLILFLVTLLVIVTFIGFNVENRSDIRLWFGDSGLIKDVPIFVSLFIMYVLGVLSVIPSILVWTFQKKKANKSENHGSDRKGAVGKKKKDESYHEGIEDEDSGD